jgi:DUF1365 family protein
MNTHSCIYQGWVDHQRFQPKPHGFRYSIFFLALDLDELEAMDSISGLFKKEHFAPLTFRRSDYIGDSQVAIKQSVWNKVRALGGDCEPGRVLFVGQVRCFGLYFSPINMYYCYNQADELCYLLAEVSNTPWNETHYYLVKQNSAQITDKAFHVSPFMDMNMKYHWHIKPPGAHFNLRLDSRDEQKLFSAGLAMTAMELNRTNLVNTLISIPLMSVKIIWGIYWQAMKLFWKRIPFVSHSKL